MRYLLVLAFSSLLPLALSTSLGPRAWAQQVSLKGEKQLLKTREKQERNDLKLQHKYRKQSLKRQDVPRAVKIQMKHQMKREERELSERQKNEDRKSTRLNSSHANISYAVFCLKKKKKQ